MLQTIHDRQTIIAIIIRREYRNDGITFFTPEDFSQQLAYMKRPAGHEIIPHIHRRVNRDVTLTQEVLLIRSGRVQVDFYSQDKEYLESAILEAGDVILLAAGGHGFTMLEESEIIEVKQGPYIEDMDKERFEASR